MSNSRTLHPEDQIAQYRVVGPLGAGGMGEVYLAQDQSLERSVALKVLPHELTRSDDRVRRFVQEARSASSLNHPNIVTIYEIGQEPVKSASGDPDSGPLHYISMELISGKTLGAKIHEEKTDLKTLVGYLAQAAEGIAKAHAVGIVHRDLKPGNIMVSDDGYAKVLDFGLAKLTEKSSTAGPLEATEIASQRTVEGAVMGTVSYMAPEQVQGKAVDARSDVFAFGCILYEAATRQRPFLADSNVEIMHKILNERPRPVEELNAECPAELRRVIRRCLAKAPDQRAQSMKDIAIELREIFDEYDSLSASNTSATQTMSTIPAIKKRNVMPLVVVVAAVVIAAIAFGWFGMMRGKQGDHAQPFENMRLSTQTNRGDIADCALSPDGRYIAYVAGRANQHTLRVRQVATGSDVEILPVQDASMEFPSFTPDGNYIYYCKRSADKPNYRVLMSVPSLGGPEQERGFDVDSRLAFSPDGKRACFIRNYPQRSVVALVMQDLASGQQKEIASVPGPGTPLGSPWWSPDGTYIALCIVSAPPRANSVVALFDPETGKRSDFFTRKGAFFLGGLAGMPDGSGIVLAGFDLSATLTNQIFMLSYPEGNLRRLTNDLNTYSNITAGGADAAVSAARTTAISNLYVVDTATGESRALTSTASPENSPVGLAPLGDRVYFSRLHGDFLGAASVPLAGGDATTYETGDGHVQALLAANGTILLWRITTDQQMHIWRMEPSGSIKQLTKGGGERLLRMSPDGKWFTYVVTDSTRGVWIMPTDGGEGRLVSAAAQQGVGSFSPDSKEVITIEYEVDEKGFARTVFKVMPIEGGAAVATLRLPPRGDDWSGVPGTRSVSFIDAADPNRNVYSADVDNAAVPRKVTQFTEGILRGHEWSPDGKQLAVVRRLGTDENVWVMNRDGSKPRQLTNFTGLTIQNIDWADDSRRLVTNAGQLSVDVVLIRNLK
ncbi:MAG TPA: protein kinase [Candidatus Krumholzibacteria bacterium]